MIRRSDLVKKPVARWRRNIPRGGNSTTYIHTRYYGVVCGELEEVVCSVRTLRTCMYVSMYVDTVLYSIYKGSGGGAAEAVSIPIWENVL